MGRLQGAQLACLMLLLGVGHEVSARNYPLNGEVIGELALTTTVRTDTIADIARAYSQGYNEMRLANPAVDPWLTGDDTEVVIPSQYVLPKAPQDGVIINIPEMRMYYFPASGKGAPREVATYPISIGRQDWSTPHGATTVVSKVKDPSWTPPASIRKEHAAQGEILPAVVPPGPKNPLGAFTLKLGFSGYMIHGTDKPFGIGMRVTHGCMRMYPQDIATVFKTVPVGTKVHLVNQPFKVGLLEDRLMLEVHPPLDEDAPKIMAEQFSTVVGLLLPYSTKYELALNWKALRAAVYQRTGVPTEVGRISPRLPATAATALSATP